MSNIDRKGDLRRFERFLGDTDLSVFEDDVVELVESGMEFSRLSFLAYAKRIISKCESPIERIFAATLCKMLFPSNPLDEWSIQVPAGNYRIDFVYTFQVVYGGRSVGVAVELDGHDFHEKTKEQAQRDKEKDRFLQKEGYFVFRFTGSEVFKAPERCLKEVEEFAWATHYERYPIDE